MHRTAIEALAPSVSPAGGEAPSLFAMDSRRGRVICRPSNVPSPGVTGNTFTWHDKHCRTMRTMHVKKLRAAGGHPILVGYALWLPCEPSEGELGWWHVLPHSQERKCGLMFTQYSSVLGKRKSRDSSERGKDSTGGETIPREAR